MVYSTVVYKFHINIQSASKEDPSFGERGNSGEIPGRSGHCNQGVESSETIGILLRRMDSVLICKSGNLLNSFNESFRRKYFILINIFDNTIY